jgi:hypothetical protein
VGQMPRFNVSYTGNCRKGKIAVDAVTLEEAMVKIPHLLPGCTADLAGSYEISPEFANEHRKASSEYESKMKDQ